MGRAYSEVRIQFEQQETEGDDYFVLVQTRDPDDEFASVEVLTPEGWKPYTPDIRKYADSYMWDDRGQAEEALVIYMQGARAAEDRAFISFR